MCIMEDTTQYKEKNEDIQTRLHETNPTLQRPKNFSLQRRREVYYFSDNSAKGILKRVPFKKGSYRFNELATVLEKPGAAKIQNESLSDASLNNPGSSKADKNSTAIANEESYEAKHHEKEKEAFLQSVDETAEIKLPLHGLKNLTLQKANKDCHDTQTKNDGKKQLKVINQGQKEESLKKLFQGHKKKKYQTNVCVSIDSEKLKTSVSNEKRERLSASNVISSSTKKEDKSEGNRNETRTESSLNADELNKIQMKTPTTEL